MALEKEEVLEIVEKVIDTEFERRALIICNPNYFSNMFLEFAMHNHMTLQCIVRTYLEMQKASMQFAKPNALLETHLRQTITYLNLYVDEIEQQFVADHFSGLKASYMEKYPYLLMECKNRFKSFRSILAKFRTARIAVDAINWILNNLNSIPEFEKFEKMDIIYAKSVLQQKLTQYNLKSPLKDLVGYRSIVDAYAYSSEETVLVKFLYDLSEHIFEYSTKNNFDRINFKDYIKKPKQKTNYQSLHQTFLYGVMMTEFQLRTRTMDNEAEYGDANHDEVYKNTIIQNFLKEFMYDISAESGRTSSLESIGFLKSFSLPKQFACWTPEAEVPQTYEQLVEFEDTTLIKKMVEDSPTFDDTKR